MIVIYSNKLCILTDTSGSFWVDVSSNRTFRDLEMSLRLAVDFLTYSGGFSGVELFDFVYCLLLDGIVHAVKIK